MEDEFKKWCITCVGIGIIIGMIIHAITPVKIETKKRIVPEIEVKINKNGIDSTFIYIN